MVAQENILFYDTVWNNICYGLTGMAEERVVAAAQAALAHDFINELPQGYNTLVGERGTQIERGPESTHRDRARDPERFTDFDSG